MLAALLNGLRATDNSVRFCPAIDATYNITFNGRSWPTTSRRGSHRLQRRWRPVNGKVQPPLWDPGERLIHALHKLLGLSHRYR